MNCCCLLEKLVCEHDYERRVQLTFLLLLFYRNARVIHYRTALLVFYLFFLYIHSILCLPILSLTHVFFFSFVVAVEYNEISHVSY